MNIGNLMLELAGWTLLLIGLFVFYTCFTFLDNGQVVEGGVGGGIGFVIFRGGIAFVRLAVANRALRANIKSS